MFGLMLKEMFLDKTSGFATRGAHVIIVGESLRMFAKLANVLSDGDGLRLLYAWKGASALKCCLVHSNVLKKGSGALTSRAYVEISCANPDKFKVRTKADFCKSYDLVRSAARRLEANGMTKTLHDQLTMAEGFNYIDLAMPYDQVCRDLGIFEAITMDWVHSAVQDGFFNVEGNCFLRSANAKIGVEWSAVEEHLKLPWVFPMCIRSKCKLLHRVFSEHRQSKQKKKEESDEHKIKGTASECLGVYTLLRDFVETQIGDEPELEQERQSFDCACLVIDILMKAKAHTLSMTEAADQIIRALADHMAKHTAVYGDRYLKPKHHWMFDVAMQMLRDCMVLDCLIVERLHLTIRRASEKIDNLRSFEASVLSGAINEQIAKLQNLEGKCCLTQRHAQKGLFGFDDAPVC